MRYSTWEIAFSLICLLTCVSIGACNSNHSSEKSNSSKISRSTSSPASIREIGEIGEKNEDKLSEQHPLPFPIAFTSERDGNREIYVTLYAGSSGINISNNPGDDIDLKPFRDGGVFISTRDGDDDIFFVHYNQKLVFDNLTKNPATEKQLAVSPDLQNLLFTSNREGDMDIFLYQRDGFPPRNLTRNEASDEMPIWMPDQRNFLFESDRTGDYDIFIQPIEGGPAKNLTDNPAEDRFPSVSPDGKSMAFESSRDGNIKIYLYKFDGGSVVNLSGDAKYDNTPLFSHDGKFLAFNHGIDENQIKVMIMNLADRSTRQITDYEKSIGVSGFSLDDKWLMYVSKRTGNFDVYIINLENGESIDVTSNPASDYYPAFLPSADFPLIKSIAGSIQK